MGKKSILGLSVLSLLMVVIALRADVELVKDGEPTAEIVIPKDPLSSVKLAAEDVQTYVKLMSGAELPIVETPSKDVENHVYVGESELTRKLGVTTDDLKVDGFKIVAKGNNLILLGLDEQRKPFPYRWHGDDIKKWWAFAGEKYGVPVTMPFNGKVGFYPYDATATLSASSELLEQLGVRFYAPYENGTVIPKKRSIAVPEQVLSKAPAFPIRQPAYYPQYCDPDGLKWFKRLGYGSSYLYGGAHATSTIIGQPEQKTEHPEYFAEVNGKRIGSLRGGVPRFTNESFRKSSINFLDKTFEAYPYLAAFDLMPPDGLGQVDERDAKIWSRSERGYNSRYSDYLWDYWLWAAKELKKKRPDKYLVAWSYSPYAGPPSGDDAFPDNVAMYFCQNTASSFLPQFNSDKLRGEFLSRLTSKKLYIYDYFLFYRTEQRPRYPVVFTKHLQDDMKKLAGACEGKNIEMASEYSKEKGHRIACSGLTHLLIYLQGKLFWNPDLDLQALLDEYYELYFGPAKAEMKEFYEFAEEVWMRPKARRISDTHGFLHGEDIDRYFDILKRAREKAGEGTVYDKRITEIEREMAPLKKAKLGMKRVGPKLVGYFTREPVTIDGDLNEPFWRKERSWEWYPMRDLVTGAVPDKNKARVSFRMTPDKSALVIGVECDEAKMGNLTAKAEGHDDGAVFNDDAVEIYVETPERSYFKIVINSNGAVWDESQDVTIVTRDTLPILWQPEIQAAVRKYEDRWTAEILIPTKDFGTLGPTAEYPWGVNVCRTRLAGGGKPEYFAIAPTGKLLFAELSKFGNLRVK